jgi:hypothetical protein
MSLHGDPRHGLCRHEVERLREHVFRDKVRIWVDRESPAEVAGLAEGVVEGLGSDALGRRRRRAAGRARCRARRGRRLRASSSDLAFLSTTDPASASGSITDPAGLAPFIGPGTVPFSWTSSSNADIIQPSEWDIWFVAQGELEVTVTLSLHLGVRLDDDGPCDDHDDAVHPAAVEHRSARSDERTEHDRPTVRATADRLRLQHVDDGRRGPRPRRWQPRRADLRSTPPARLTLRRPGATLDVHRACWDAVFDDVHALCTLKVTRTAGSTGPGPRRGSPSRSARRSRRRRRSPSR